MSVACADATANAQAAAAATATGAAREDAQKRDFEKRVAAWCGGRRLAVLLGDLQAIFPPAPAILVDPAAAGPELKKAYMRAARAVHPDKLAGADRDTALLAQVPAQEGEPSFGPPCSATRTQWPTCALRHHR